MLLLGLLSARVLLLGGECFRSCVFVCMVKLITNAIPNMYIVLFTLLQKYRYEIIVFNSLFY